MAQAPSAPLWPRLRPAVPALVLGLLVLGLLYHAEAVAAVHVWNTSTAYGHCWLVLPIAGWMAWERRFQAAAAPLRPAWWPAILAVPLAAAWLGADLVGVMEGRQLVAIALLELVLIAGLGWRLWHALAAALAYLIFLVPFGAFVTPMLQDFTAAFVSAGLDFLAVPNQVTAYRIDIPEGSFYVAQACAGLRFLIASVAFGTLYAFTMFQSPWRRAAFIVVSVLVPIVANGFRALGIVLLGHGLGSAQAAATDHVLYGWIFFSIVIVLLAAAGMPFRQDPPPPPPPGPVPPPGTARRVLLCVWPVLLAAALGPAAGLWLDSRTGTAPEAANILRLPDDCTLTAFSRQGPVITQSLRCGADTRITARLEVLPPYANPSRVLAAAEGPAGALLPGADQDGGVLPVDGGPIPRFGLLRDENHPAAAAYILFINRRAALGGVHDRMELARDMLLRTGTPAVALAVAVTHTSADALAALQAYLAAQGDIAARVPLAVGK